jgi:hypothetical protein
MNVFITILTQSMRLTLFKGKECVYHHSKEKNAFIIIILVLVQVFTQRPRNGRIKLCHCTNREILVSEASTGAHPVCMYIIIM